MKYSRRAIFIVYFMLLLVFPKENHVAMEIIIGTAAPNLTVSTAITSDVSMVTTADKSQDETTSSFLTSSDKNIHNDSSVLDVKDEESGGIPSIAVVVPVIVVLAASGVVVIYLLRKRYMEKTDDSASDYEAPVPHTDTICRERNLNLDSANQEPEFLNRDLDSEPTIEIDSQNHYEEIHDDDLNRYMNVSNDSNRNINGDGSHYLDLEETNRKEPY